MAKKATEQQTENQTALAEQPAASPPAFPEGTPRPGLMDGGDANDFAIPVLHLFQDIGNESELYGDHEKGTWVDSITQEAVENLVVVPVYGKKEIVVWYDRNSSAGDGIVERFDRRSDIPAEITENQAPSGDYNIVDTISWFFILGDNAMPHVVRFKSTSLKAARQLNTLEASRAAQGKTLGQYKLGARQKTNDKGKWYVPTVTAAGDATPEQVELAKAAHKLVTGGGVKVHEAAEEHDEPAPF